VELHRKQISNYSKQQVFIERCLVLAFNIGSINVFMCPNPHHVLHHRALVSRQCIKYTCSVIDVIHILVLFGYHLKSGTEYVKNI